MTIEDLEARFATVSAERTNHTDQQLGIIACSEALAAARMGNYGVGALLIDPMGEVLERGRNTVFFPHFRSDLHAEMVVMTAFEQRHPPAENMRGYTLLCSLEPCPMCAGALVNARIGRLVYGARDPKAGACGSLYDIVRDPRLNHRVPVVEGVRAAECGEILRAFFRGRREKAGPGGEAADTEKSK